MFKGDDRMFVEMNEGIDNQIKQTLNYDEIGNYEDFRYISATEADWRLSDYPLYFISHSVDRLPAHLENEQNVTMPENPTEEQIEWAANKDSKLMAFFKLNQEIESEIEKANEIIENLKIKGKRFDHIKVPKKILYTHVGVNHVWETKESKWRPRKKTTKPKLCRMYSVNPK